MILKSIVKYQIVSRYFYLVKNALQKHLFYFGGDSSYNLLTYYYIIKIIYY